MIDNICNIWRCFEELSETLLIKKLKNPEIAFKDCITSLHKDYLKTMQEELSKAIDAEPEKEKRQQLLKELQQITKERNQNFI